MEAPVEPVIPRGSHRGWTGPRPPSTWRPASGHHPETERRGEESSLSPGVPSPVRHLGVDRRLDGERGEERWRRSLHRVARELQLRDPSTGGSQLFQLQSGANRPQSGSRSHLGGHHRLLHRLLAGASDTEWRTSRETYASVMLVLAYDVMLCYARTRYRLGPPRCALLFIVSVPALVGQAR